MSFFHCNWQPFGAQSRTIGFADMICSGDTALDLALLNSRRKLVDLLHAHGVRCYTRHCMLLKREAPHAACRASATTSATSTPQLTPPTNSNNRVFLSAHLPAITFRVVLPSVFLGFNIIISAGVASSTSQPSQANELSRRRRRWHSLQEVATCSVHQPQ